MKRHPFARPLLQTMLLSGLFSLILMAACSPTPTPGSTATPTSTAASIPAPTLSAPKGLTSSKIDHSDPRVWDSNLRFERMNSGDGLSQNSVMSITQDPQGFIWFGTQDGLNRFDGNHFVTYQYSPQDSTSLSDNAAWVLYMDRQGNLWVGTLNGGLNKFDRKLGQFVHYRHKISDPKTLSSDCIQTILEGADGTFWVGTCDGGLNRLNRHTGEVTRYNLVAGDDRSISANEVSALYEDRRGYLWVGTSAGLDRLTPETGEMVHYIHQPDQPNSYPGSAPTAILEDEQGNLWIGTRENGLALFDPQTQTFTRFQSDPFKPDGLIDNHIRALWLDRNGLLWIGTYGGGVERLDRNTGHFIHNRRKGTDPNSLSSDLVTTIYEDRSGVIWVGTNGQGVNRYNPQTNLFANYRYMEGQAYSLSHPEVYAVVEDNYGWLWIGTADGLDRIQKGTGRIYHYRKNPQSEKSLSDNFITALMQDNLGYIWIGTAAGGVDRYDPIQREFLQIVHHPGMPYSLSSNQVTSLLQDSTGQIWVGTADAGLNRLLPNSIPLDPDATPANSPPMMTKEEFRAIAGSEKSGLIPESETASAGNLLLTGSFTSYLHRADLPSTLSSNEINCIAEDENRMIWVGTNHGLNRLDPSNGVSQHYLHDPRNPNSLGDDNVLAILIGDAGEIWIGTDGGGLDRLDRASGEFSHYRQQDGLPNNVVYSILEDESGYLWLSTNNGLSRFNPQSGTFENFDETDGLQGDEFNKGAFYRTQTGELIFGGYNGATVFSPAQLVEDPYTPQVELISLTQNGTPLKLPEPLEDVYEVTLFWPDNFFEFEFAGLSYAQPERNQYAYKLDGFDQNWNEIGNQRIGRYSNLPGGTYKLQLKAANADGVWNETGRSLLIRVEPPFWQTLWFQIGVVISALTVLGGGYALRLHRIQVRNRDLEKIVNQRTSDLQHKTIALERTTHDLEERNQEIDQRRAELQALYEADDVVRRHLNLDQVLQALVNVAVELLSADHSAVLVWDEHEGQIIPKAARGFSEHALARLVFGRGEGVVGRVASTGEPILSQDITRLAQPDTTDPAFVETIRSEGVRSYLLLPVKMHHEVFGVFNASFDRPDAATVEALHLFQSLAQRAALAIRNAQLYEQARDLAILEERNRLARDLHDSAKQKAFAALAQLGAVDSLVRKDPANALVHLSEAEGLVHDVLQEIDTIVQELHPAALQTYGLAIAAREYAFDWAARNNIEIDLQIEAKTGAFALPIDIEQSVYRIIQEGLANISRHSRASKAWVSLRRQPDLLLVEIRDNGIGFELEKVHAGLGLCSMEERAKKIHGLFAVKSAPGEGTRIQLSLPICVLSGE